MTGRGFTRLLGVACAAALSFMLDALLLDSHGAFAQGTPASQAAGPRFRPDGPDADAFGQKEAYPSCKGIAYVDDTRCRVGGPRRGLLRPRLRRRFGRAGTLHGSGPCLWALFKRPHKSHPPIWLAPERLSRVAGQLRTAAPRDSPRTD